MCESIKGKHRKIESRTAEFKFSEWKQMKLSDVKSMRFLLRTCVDFNYSVTATMPRRCCNDSIHQWRKKDLLIALIDISQTNTNTSCVLQTNKSYIFYTDTVSVVCFYNDILSHSQRFILSNKSKPSNNWCLQWANLLTGVNKNMVSVKHCYSLWYPGSPFCTHSAGRKCPTVTTLPDCRDQVLVQIKTQMTARENSSRKYSGL